MAETHGKALPSSGKGFPVVTERFIFWCNGRALILSLERCPKSLFPVLGEQPGTPTPSGFHSMLALRPSAPARCQSPGSCKLQENVCMSSVALGRPSVKEGGSVVVTLACTRALVLSFPWCFACSWCLSCWRGGFKG